MIRYEDNLQVTEIEPILAYIRSSFAPQELSEEAILEIQSELEKELKRKREHLHPKKFGCLKL